ncbi:late competence development ComFB family protein [Fundidesulfovibrio butyratiphilus]
MPKKPPLEIRGVPLEGIRNRNECRVAKVLERVLDEMAEDFTPDPLDVQDIYALTLNLLPSRYAQRATIILKEPVKECHIETAIRRAIRVVRERPKY